MGVVDDFSDSFDADGRGVLADESSGGGFGDDFGEGGFARAGWAMEDDGGQCVGVDHSAEELALAEEMGLSDHLIEGSRAYASSQRLDGLECGIAVRFPEIGHTGIVRCQMSEKIGGCVD